MTSNYDPLQNVLSKLGGVKQSGQQYSAQCPAHDDRHNSLCIGVGDDGRVLLDCKAGCDTALVVEKLDLHMRDLFPRRKADVNDRGKGGGYNPGSSTATAQQSPAPPGCTLSAYAEAKHLPLDFLARLGLSQFTYQGAPAVRIPYNGETGVLESVRFRTALEKQAEVDGRFKWKSGNHAISYGLWRLDDARKAEYIVIVEGESDCHTLWLHNQPALGIPGADTWKVEWEAYLDDIPIVYVVIEPDKGGETVRKWVGQSKLRDRVRLIELGAKKDPSGLYLSNPVGFQEEWQAALDRATPWVEVAQADAERKMKEAWAECKGLASTTDILALFAEALAHNGLTGEERAAKLIFLGVTSRFLDRPASIAVKGPSSAGKSYTVEKVLEFFPASAYYALSAMSERAIAYSKEPLEHRILVIYEAAGLSSDFASYLIRSLLSEGRVRYETVEKTKDGLQPRLIVREGPTGLLVTTTAISLHPENETRLLSIPVTDTPEQTRQVMRALARENGGQRRVNMEEWHALQDWLAGAEHRVTIPYAEMLAELIPSEAVRLRRDFGMLLNLIRAHAILHQATRGRDSEGRIIALLSDYAAVRDLVTDLVSEGVGATVSDTLRKTVNGVDELCRAGAETISLAKLAEHLHLHSGTVSRRVSDCLSRGYLHNEETKKGTAFKLKVGDPLPEAQEILPRPERLANAQGKSEDRCAVAPLLGGIDVPPTPPEQEAQPVSVATLVPSASESVPASAISGAAMGADVAKAYETKATIPGGVPPYERVLAQQEWLASIDWRYGLRCGLSKQQCRVCKGVPCRDSTEWRQADGNA